MNLDHAIDKLVEADKPVRTQEEVQAIIDQMTKQVLRAIHLVTQEIRFVYDDEAVKPQPFAEPWVIWERLFDYPPKLWDKLSGMRVWGFSRYNHVSFEQKRVALQKMLDQIFSNDVKGR